MTLPVRRSAALRPAGDGARIDPLSELEQLQEHMTQLMTAVLGADPFAVGNGAWTPLADVTESDDAYLVEIEVPGVQRKDVTVEVAGGELRITGEIVEKERIGWFRHRTRRAGQFAYRTLLPGDIDVDSVTADLANGVLTVRVPKTEAARPRRIAVNAA